MTPIRIIFIIGLFTIIVFCIGQCNTEKIAHQWIDLIHYFGDLFIFHECYVHSTTLVSSLIRKMFRFHKFQYCKDSLHLKLLDIQIFDKTIFCLFTTW